MFADMGNRSAIFRRSGVAAMPMVSMAHNLALKMLMLATSDFASDMFACTSFSRFNSDAFGFPRETNEPDI